MDPKYKLSYEQAKKEWLDIWSFYQRLKAERNLTAEEILKQLDIPCYPYTLELLSISNLTGFMPSFKPGTAGKETRDLLSLGLKKTNWSSPSKIICDENFYKFSPKIEEFEEGFW